MQKILVLSGKKQSGKTSASNYIHGYILRENGIFRDMGINTETGHLVVNSSKRLESGEVVDVPVFMGFGEDRVLTEPYYVEYASKKIWPFVKRYSFADILKEQAIKLFHLTVDQCYGSDEDKNSDSTVKWEYVMRVFGAYRTRAIYAKMTKQNDEDFDEYLNECMTARQFLQVYGTEICRAIHPDCWLDATINRVLGEGSPIAIIDDGRFPNEIDKVKKLENNHNVEVKTMRFERDLFSDSHGSETALDDYNGFDLVIPPECGLEEKHKLMITALTQWGWI